MAFVTAFASDAHALQLDWQAPTGCPTAEAVRLDITRLAGESEGDALIARAIVTPTADARFRVVIDLAGSATGHRTLTGDTCRQIARASALIIALAANPEASLELHADEPNDTKGAAATSAIPDEQPNPSRPISVTPTQSPRKSAPRASDSIQSSSPLPTEIPIKGNHPRRRWTLMALAGREWGTLPTPTDWLGFESKFRASSYPLSAAFGTMLTQRTSAEYIGMDVGARFQAAIAQARLCVEPSNNGWFVEACGGVQVSVIRAHGYVRPNGLGRNGVSEVDAFTRYRWIPG
ncbi:MAG TPA: hypothetical protein VIV60_11245, partial [Polyangiaceae bacterium]